MSRLEKTRMSPEAQRELGAIDAVLGGESVAEEHVALAELALAMRALRPRPSDEFVQALDSRAARGFGPDSHEAPASDRARPLSSTESKGGRRLKIRRTALPALGLAVAVLLAVALTASLSGSRGGRAAQPVSAGSGRTVQAGPMVSAPAAGAKGASASPAFGGAEATRLLERTSTLDIGVTQDSIQSAAQRVFTLASAFGGYVKQSNVSSGGPAQGGANFDIRLPSSNLSSAIAALSHLGHVRSENDATNDVSVPRAASRPRPAAIRTSDGRNTRRYPIRSAAVPDSGRVRRITIASVVR